MLADVRLGLEKVGLSYDWIEEVVFGPLELLLSVVILVSSLIDLLVVDVDEVEVDAWSMFGCCCLIETLLVDSLTVDSEGGEAPRLIVSVPKNNFES